MVSVGDKQSTNTRMVSALPNNPSNKDRQQLQRTMASAITNKRMATSGSGIKTIIPLRKPSQSSSVQRRTVPSVAVEQQTRGVKRSRHRGSYGGSPYKKRAHYGSSDSEQEPSEKRSLHNNMERQRRIDLRNAFEDLRRLVPEVSKRDRAAKVVILREAAVYCDQLGDVSERLENQVDDLHNQQDRFRSKLSSLRRLFASRHVKEPSHHHY